MIMTSRVRVLADFLPKSPEDLGKTYTFPDGREGVWLGAMENDDELAFRAQDGSIFTIIL